MGTQPTNRLTATIVTAAATAVGLGGGSRAAVAAPTVFDFESTATTSAPGDDAGALSTLTTAVNGTSLTLTRNGGIHFDIVNGSTSGFPAVFGSRSLDPFSDPSTPTGYFIGNLSVPVSSVGLDFGDYDGDEDLVTLTGYSGPNGTGTALATNTIDYPRSANFSINNGYGNDYGTVSVAAAGIESFTLADASTYPNSLSYDNIAVTPAAVPEPATAGLLARRSRSRVVTA